MSVSNVTVFRWEIVDLRTKYNFGTGSRSLTSNLFTLSTRSSSVQFALFTQYGNCFVGKNGFTVILKQIGDKDKPVEASVKSWIESTTGQRFGEAFVEKHVFSKIGDQCDCWGLSNDDNAFWDLYAKNETFYICYELTDLNGRATSTANNDQKFHQDQWTLYEEELHDAIIKADGTEFKVLKHFFIAHSKVFKAEFLSKFKEGVTSKIEVKDVDAETMKHLVKWFYTNQLEDEGPIEKLFAAADKYDIALLKEMCTENMLDTLDATNAFQRLILASTHSDKNLKETTLDVISGLSTTDFAEFLTSDDWLNFHGKNPGVAKEVGKLIREKMRK